MADGTRLVDLPAVATVTSATKFAVASPGAGLATAAAVRAHLGGIGLNDPATGAFYASAGGRINRLNDRVFVGAATVNDGNAFPNSSGADYVTTNIPQGPTTSVAQMAVLSSQGTMGIMAGTRTSDASPSGAQGAIGIMGVAINDATGANRQSTFAAYFEGQQKTGAGFVAALEVDTCNQTGAVVAINPYTFFETDHPCVNIWSAAGGARSNVVDTTAAMAVLANGAKYDKGIVFQAGCLTTNVAIGLAKEHAVQWWAAGATPTSFIQSTATENNYGILFTSTATFIGNSTSGGSTASLAVAHQNNAVNFVQVTGAAVNNPVKIQAAGASDAIDLALFPKNGGRLVLGGPAGATSATGGSASALPGAPVFYFSFKFNNDGINYKIPVYGV